MLSLNHGTIGCFITEFIIRRAYQSNADTMLTYQSNVVTRVLLYQKTRSLRLNHSIFLHRADSDKSSCGALVLIGLSFL